MAGGVRRGDFCGGEKHRGACWRAQRATCTCSPRLSERNGAKRNAASSASQPTPEHRSGVFAKRKPPQYEPRRTPPAANPASATANSNVSTQPPPRPVEMALLASVFVVAACGLVYELAAAALASYVLGDSVLQFSTM